MARIGDGISSNGVITGAAWPGGFDTLWTRNNVSNPVTPSDTTLHRELINDGLSYALHIASKLGANPLGSFPSLQARLAPYIPTAPGGANPLVSANGKTLTINDLQLTGGLYGIGYADIKIDGATNKRIDFSDTGSSTLSGTFSSLSARLDAYIPLTPSGPNPWKSISGQALTVSSISTTGGLFNTGYIDIKIDGATTKRFSFTDNSTGMTTELVSYTPTGTGGQSRPLTTHLGDFMDVKAFGALGNGVQNDATLIANANTAAGNKILYFPSGTYVIGGNITLNTIFMGHNTKLSVNSGVIVNIAHVIAPFDTQIFDGSGHINITSKEPVYVRWFGAIGDATTNSTTAILAADTCGSNIVRVAAGTYLVNTTTLSAKYEFLNGGVFKVPAGQALTFVNPWLAEEYKIFDANESSTGAVRCVAKCDLYVAHWGAKADGVTDDMRPIQAALNVMSASGGGAVHLMHGTHKVSGTLTMTGHVQTLRGRENGGTIIQGTFASGDILYAGTPTGVNIRYYITDVTINSSVVKTSGAGLHCQNLNQVYIQNVAAESGANLYDGAYFETTTTNQINNFICRGTNICVKVKESFDLYIMNALIIGGGIGIYVGGGSGGLYFDFLDILLNTRGFVMDRALSGTDNGQMFFGAGCFIDSSSSHGVHINDTGGWNAFFSGTWISSSTGCGIVVETGNSTSRLCYVGGTIYNNQQQGILTKNANTRIFVDGVSLSLNVGVALETTVVNNSNFIVGVNDYFLATGGAISGNITGGTNLHYVSTDSFKVQKPSNGVNEVGMIVPATGNTTITASGVAPLQINRTTNDGTLMDFLRNGVSQGSIQVSGTTVSYNTFTGSHFAQWGTGYEPGEEPQEGTLLSTVDEPYERWYCDEDRVACDHDGAILVPKPQLVRVRITATANDNRVYGVYGGVDDHGDISVFGLGTAMVRVMGPIEGGDLITASDTPGIAKRQNSDVITSRTLGKTSRGDDETGERLIPCVLYVG